MIIISQNTKYPSLSLKIKYINPYCISEKRDKYFNLTNSLFLENEEYILSAIENILNPYYSTLLDQCDTKIFAETNDGSFDQDTHIGKIGIKFVRGILNIEIDEYNIDLNDESELMTVIEITEGIREFMYQLYNENIPDRMNKVDLLYPQYEMEVRFKSNGSEEKVKVISDILDKMNAKIKKTTIIMPEIPELSSLLDVLKNNKAYDYESLKIEYNLKKITPHERLPEKSS